MIIQCEKCRTKFRLDDSRVTDKGVKVRCTKCKHVFKVQKETAESPSFESDSALSAVSAPLFGLEPSDDATAPDSPVEQDAPLSSSFDPSAFSFEGNDLPTPDAGSIENAALPPQVGETDFTGFDFGAGSEAPDLTPLSVSADDTLEPAAFKTAAEAPKESVQGLDFSDDDMFGAVVPATPEISDETISFDFGVDSFAESMDMSAHDSTGKHGSQFTLDTPAEAPLNLGEIDFGDELSSVAVQQVNPDDLQPSREILFAPLAKSPEKSADDELKRAFLGDESTAHQQELPPLSITSRRKHSPLFGAIIALAAVLAISGVAYFGYSTYTASREDSATEQGKIGIRAVKASFVKNSEAGDLLVVTGEVFNEYSKPRASLQVKAVVFDAAGQPVATKNAYGGNTLSDAQLKALPLARIEAAMGNQFGDSLANMEVAPGKAIPFVVVLANLPGGARDFTVQPAGSTVATGK